MTVPSDESIDQRETFLTIAVLEHHQMRVERFDTDEMRDRLGEVWRSIAADAKNGRLQCLSASGPPLYDGQTFYPNDYAEQR